MMNNAYEKHPYFQYNPDLYPTRAQQIDFLTAYVEEFKRSIKENRVRKQQQQQQINLSEHDVNQNEENGGNNNIHNNSQMRSNKCLNIENLITEANYFALASHIFWAYWGVCQAAVCKINFEYLVRF